MSFVVYVFLLIGLLGHSLGGSPCSWLPKSPVNDIGPTYKCILIPNADSGFSSPQTFTPLVKEKRPSLLFKCKHPRGNVGSGENDFPRRVGQALNSIKQMTPQPSVRDVLIINCDLGRLPPASILPDQLMGLAVRQSESLNFDPDDLIPLHHLKTLDLSDNALPSLPPGSCCPIRESVNHLNLAGNRFTRFEDSGVVGNKTECELNNLITLQLSGNRLHEVPYKSFKMVGQELRTLKLDHNRLVTVTEDAFEGLDKLRVLDLSYNHLNLLSEGTFESLSFLRELYLHFNRLTVLNKGHFRGLNNLLLLNLSYNALGSGGDGNGGTSMGGGGWIMNGDHGYYVGGGHSASGATGHGGGSIGGGGWAIGSGGGQSGGHGGHGGPIGGGGWTFGQDGYQGSASGGSQGGSYGSGGSQGGYYSPGGSHSGSYGSSGSQGGSYGSGGSHGGSYGSGGSHSGSYGSGGSHGGSYGSGGSHSGPYGSGGSHGGAYGSRGSYSGSYGSHGADGWIIGSSGPSHGLVSGSGDFSFSVFEHLHQLSTLDLSHNHIQNIVLDEGTDVSSLKYLDLSYNRLYSLPDGAFRQLPNLVTLILSGNRMHTVSSGSFYGLNQLNTLYMSHNQLKNLPRDCFGYAPRLEELELNNNLFRSIPELRALNELRTLNFNHNSISSIKHENFVHMPNLRGLKLSHNLLTELHKDTFTAVPKLRMLNLSHNQIASIHQSTFELLTKLMYLRLDSNKLDDINGLLTTQHHLQWFNVSSNQLPWFDYAFVPKSLLWLDLSHNRVEEIGNFYDMQTGYHLKHLDASNNNLQKLDRLALQGSLEEVNFQNNAIKEIAPNTFSDLNNLTSADLSNNQISKMAINSMALKLNPGKSATLRLANNPLVCDCDMEWLQRINDLSQSSPSQYPRVLDLDSLSCTLINKHSRPGDGNENPLLPLLSVRPDQFICEYETHCFALCLCCPFFACDCRMKCSEGCSCYHDQTWSTNIINCGNRNHSQVPDMIPMDATSIYLDGNPQLTDISGDTFIGRKHLTSLYLNNSGITEISNRTFSGLAELLILRLDNNQLQTLSGGEFTDLKSLRELYLHDNELTSVAGNTFKPLTDLEVLTLHGNKLNTLGVSQILPAESTALTGVKEMSLTGNPWSCSCDFVKEVQEVINAHRDRIVDVDELVCDNGGELVNIGNYNVTCPVGSRPGLIIGLIPVIVIAFLFVLALLTFCCLALCCRNRLYMWMNSKYGFRLTGPVDAHDKERKYDAYVHYAPSDDQFTRQLLTRNLEDYRLCLRHRDIDEKSAAALASAAKSSGRVVLLGTPAYLADKAAQSEFATVVDAVGSRKRPDQILVILKEDVLGAGMAGGPRRQEELKRKLMESPLLKDATFMTWGSESFWNRFRYNLPEHPLDADVSKKSQQFSTISSQSKTAAGNPASNPFLNNDEEDSARNTCTTNTNIASSTYTSSLVPPVASAPRSSSTLNRSHNIENTSSNIHHSSTLINNNSSSINNNINVSSASTMRANEKSSYNEDYDDMWTYLKGSGGGGVQGSGGSSLSTRSTTDGHAEGHLTSTTNNNAFSSHAATTNRTLNSSHTRLYNASSSSAAAASASNHSAININNNNTINNTLSSNSGAMILRGGVDERSGSGLDGGHTTTTTTTTTVIKRHIVENPFDNASFLDLPPNSSSTKHLLPHLADTAEYMTVSEPIYHTLDARGRLIEEGGSKIKKQSTVYIDSDLKVVYPPKGANAAAASAASSGLNTTGFSSIGNAGGDGGGGGSSGLVVHEEEERLLGGGSGLLSSSREYNSAYVPSPAPGGSMSRGSHSRSMNQSSSSTSRFGTSSGGAEYDQFRTAERYDSSALGGSINHGGTSVSSTTYRTRNDSYYI